MITLLALMVIAVGLAPCGGSSEPQLLDTTAASVIAYLDDVDYTESWELWPGLGEKYAGEDPHGMLLTTYLNPAAFDALDAKGGHHAEWSHHSQGKLHSPRRLGRQYGHVQERRATTLTTTTGSGSRFWPTARSRKRARWKAARPAMATWQTTTTSGPGC